MTLPKSILFVCLGNICRSPSAESVMRAKCKAAGLDIVLDSAGTGGHHAGESPDSRAIKMGRQLGYDLSDLTARQVKMDDFYKFDLIFAMDNANFRDLKILAQGLDKKDAIAKILPFDDKSVADPYYGNERDFLTMFTHIEQVADTWILRWQNDR